MTLSEAPDHALVLCLDEKSAMPLSDKELPASVLD